MQATYGYSGVVHSLKAKVYYMSRETFENYFKFASNGHAQKEYAKRIGFLEKQLKTIQEVS